jgi:hypothetical protein
VVITRYIPIFEGFLSTSKRPDEVVTSLLQGGPCLKKMRKNFSQGHLYGQPHQKSHGNPDFCHEFRFWIGLMAYLMSRPPQYNQGPGHPFTSQLVLPKVMIHPLIRNILISKEELEEEELEEELRKKKSRNQGRVGSCGGI